MSAAVSTSPVDDVGHAFRNPVVLITGGAGFLGRALIRELLSPAGAPVLTPREIRVLDLTPVEGELGRRVTSVVGDLRSLPSIEHAFAGVDLVFHCAALVDWGQHREEEVEAVNVLGTRNVIAACRTHGVRALVYTSSLDVLWSRQPIHDADESLAYPKKHSGTYGRTKAEAEQAVLAANDTAPRLSTDPRPPLMTLSIRPCSIWGEGDHVHMGSLLKMSRRVPLIRLGNGRALSQFSYVGNVAHLHLLAARALLEGNSAAGGQPFFATDFPPRNFFDQFEPILHALGRRIMPRALGLPRPLMLALAYVALALAWIVRPFVRWAPLLTPFSVDFVCTDFTLVGERAERILGYRPIYSEAEAYRRTIEAFREHPAP